MAPSKHYPKWFCEITAVILIFSCLLPSKSVGLVSSSSNSGEEFKQKKSVLGSRPPACVNKCLSCRPCMATLVIPPHQKRRFGTSKEEGEDGYYLLSWKCRCGNKLFQP